MAEGMKPALKTIASQPSWVVRNGNVELAVTQLGGHMAPVTFCRNTRKPVRPYYVNPWHAEGHKLDDPVMIPLRGDFFCLPFGDNVMPLGTEQHVCHGEPATRKWSLRDLNPEGRQTTLTLSMKTRLRPGRITKKLTLIEGHNVVYCRHILEGFQGPTPLGHHATLAVPEEERSLLIASSAFKFGMTSPDVVGDPADGNYQSFEIGEKFTDLRKVPLIWKHQPFGDCSAFPARKGFCDILALFKEPSDEPAWMTATNTVENYIWFSLKDAAMQPTTVFWISNCGLHGEPLSGRNRCLGMEDVCGFLATGLVDSVKPNAATRAGIKTAVRLSPRAPTCVNYIQGVVRVPTGFGRTKRVKFDKGKATFFGSRGRKVSARVNHEFLYESM